MKFILPLTAFLLAVLSAQAQTIRADFTVDKSGGCSPLSVVFTNISSGTSPNATYLWDLGNGNTSTLKNAGAVYYQEKDYIVTLTIKDGSQTSTLTRTITVYKKPVVDFNFSPNNGCMPLMVTFTGSSLAGDGGIATYHWDFGDGTTQSAYGPSVSHPYNFKQTASVSLTAVSNNGCAGSVTKNNIITVKDPLLPGFNANQTILCNAPGTVTFNNTSTGPGTLTYLWDFGDGGSSTAKDPVYTYTQRGIYTVKMTVTSSEGCTQVSTRSNYINIADFKTDFTIPSSVICTNNTISFNNLSSPLPTQSNWILDNGYPYGTYNNVPFNFYAQQQGAGMHTLTLTNNFGPCSQTTTKQFEIKKSIQLNGFISDVVDPCFAAGVQVHFKDTTAGSTEWYWEYYHSGNQTLFNDKQEHTFAYPQDGVYNVLLRVKNAEGCSSTVTKYVAVSRPLIGVWLDAPNISEACGSLTAKFYARSTENITSYSWNFGDGGSSTEANPEHFFDHAGVYIIQLTYVTEHGCRGTATYNSIRVREKPKANFTVQPMVCGNTPVSFINTSTGYAQSYLWDFGDNTGPIVPNPIHQYFQAGDFNVRLIAYNGMCNDTIVKPAVIRVSPPFTKIIAATNTCNGSRGTVSFTDGSTMGDTWKWDFGDGNTDTYTAANHPATLEHNYNQTGKYKVVLSVTNGSCTVKDSTTVYVLLKQQPLLTFDKREACVNTNLQYQVTGLVANPRPPVTYNGSYYFTRWENEDGSPFAGSYNVPSIWETNVSGPMTAYEVRDGQVRAILGSYYFNCYDTTNYVPLKIKGVKPGFEIVADNVCFKSPVVVRDTSRSGAGDPIVSWQWNFGDNTFQTVQHGGLMEHTYANPGYYFVTLKVTDAGGCASNSSTFNYVQVAGPKAAFYPSAGTNVQLNTTITFYNNSNTYNSFNTTWQWDFGNGATANDYNPVYTYTVPGEYKVRLIAENPVTGCKDTAYQTITVKNFNSGFSQNASFVGDYGKCPPMLARFYNTSSNYTRVVWDFGDGFTLENQNNPSHIYTSPGKYIVTLYVYGYNGLTGTYKDSLFVSRPQASIHANDLDGCIGQSFTLNAPVHANAVSWLWDFGNGQIINAADSFATHVFTAAGTYMPSVLVKDNNGCQAAVTSPDKIVINPAPVIALTPVAPLVCKTTPVQLNATGAASYEWFPATGLNATTIQNPIAFPATNTLYTVKGKDAIGCVGESSIAVNVATPFEMTGVTAANVCKGNAAQLQASGADSYLWINNTSGLSGLQIPNPVARPDVTTSYTIVGYDKYKCYSDTATVNVTVRPNPSVNAGPDLETTFGAENKLSITNSPDVVRWNWTPAEFLSCTSCASPVSRHYKSMYYIVTVSNEYNCTAKDTVHVNAICTGVSIYIPNTFSPNHDGKNEVFGIGGTGVRIIRSFRIFNRWGEIIFEKKNFYPNDISGTWNGKNKGIDVDTGVYIYIAELECEANQTFERKGTVLLVR